MKNKITIVLLSLVSLLMVGCATTTKTQMTQLQMRELQTRSFAVSDGKMVMKAMLNVLQDDGFIVKNAVADLGLLSATKEVDVDSRSGFVKFWYGEDLKYKKNMVMEASANITEMGDSTNVRINFQQKVFDNYGGVAEVRTVEDAAYYQEFFSRVDKSIFIQSEKI